MYGSARLETNIRLNCAIQYITHMSVNLIDNFARQESQFVVGLA